MQNLSASLDVIVGRYPSPSRILIAGNSAGGYGPNFALPLVRKLCPDVPIDLVNDSGIGIAQPSTVERLNEEWNGSAFFPESCASCIGDDGNLTGYYKYQLAEDTNVRMTFVSTKRDETLVSGTMTEPAVWEAELIAAMADVESDFPQRSGSLILDGDAHTFIIREFDRAVGGSTVRQWIADLLADSDNWGSVSD